MTDSTTVQGGTRAALWRNITRVDRGKVNKIPIAVRNSFGVAVPLAVGIALGNPLAGVAVATGALNVCYSDGLDPYAQRARRMLAWSFIGAVAVFTGSITHPHPWLATAVTMLWAFVAGMQLAVSTRAGDLGLNTLVTLVVFSARGPTDLRGIVYGTLLVLGGGLLQTAISLLFWPVKRHEPERRALATVYAELAQGIAAPSSSLLAVPLQAPPQDVQDTLHALGRDYSVEGERFRYLFDQVDRMRLSAFALERSHVECLAEANAGLTREIEGLFSVASQLLVAIGEELVSRQGHAAVNQWCDQLEQRLECIHRASREAGAGITEVSRAADVFAGQVRSVARMASRATPPVVERGRPQASTAPQVQLKQWLGTLQANLSLSSSTCRHAIRSAVCIGIADGISRGVSWQRSYWIPMTVAVILKPDFNSTISRGFLRLMGTLAGLVVATVFYHALPTSAVTELFLVGAFTLALRLFGPANYGIFSIAISGLIVFLIAETGVAPSEVVITRGINTMAGGLLALAAYLIWPTWERKRISETFADMIDATRAYFHSLIKELRNPDMEVREHALTQVQQAWRLARSNAEGSVDRVSSEPNTTAEAVSHLTSMLASSHALAESMREMEAETLRTPLRDDSPALQRFAEHVEFTLYYLSAALRGSASATETLPQLREDHTRLVEEKKLLGSAESAILLGTDRITTTLNTLREQVIRYLSPPN